MSWGAALPWRSMAAGRLSTDLRALALVGANVVDARTFRANLLDNPDVSARLSAEALDAAMDPRRDFAQVDTIFRRVFGEA